MVGTSWDIWSGNGSGLLLLSSLHASEFLICQCCLQNKMHIDTCVLYYYVNRTQYGMQWRVFSAGYKTAVNKPTSYHTKRNHTLWYIIYILITKCTKFSKYMFKTNSRHPQSYLEKHKTIAENVHNFQQQQNENQIYSNRCCQVTK